MNSDIYIQIIEPPIYDALDWDMQKIMPALEYLRIALPHHLKGIPTNTHYYLIAHKGVNNNPFPAIGIGTDNPNALERLPDFINLNNQVENLIETELPMTKILEEIKNHPTISWQRLKEIKYYPL